MSKKYESLKDMVTDIADAIREKDHSSELIPTQFFGDRIRNIPNTIIDVHQNIPEAPIECICSTCPVKSTCPRYEE